MLGAYKQMVGRVFLGAYAVGFLGLLLIGQALMLLSVGAFVLTVGWALVSTPKRAGPVGRDGRRRWAPFAAGPWLFVVVPAVLGVPFLVSFLAGSHAGMPDIGHTGLLMPRPHYTFVDHGVATEVEPWRFLALGLLFHALWHGVGAFVAWVVFFKDPRR